MIAQKEGMSLSELVRDLLREAVIDVSSDTRRETRDSRVHGDQPAPDSLNLRDRQVLALLHRILGRVLPVDSNGPEGSPEDQLLAAEVLEAGFTGEYWREVAGFSQELSERDTRRVMDILQLFRVITYSVKRLEEQGVDLDDIVRRRLTFRGFDHNDPLENQMARYVRFQMRDGDRWTELQEQVTANDDGNSHLQMLDTYLRMLARYRRLVDERTPGEHVEDYLLTADELQMIAGEVVHPNNR
ncbi:uncharacterized protein YfbU (UPF0304 family) [Microbacterium phyllosphaerae]|uniref:Uncharacterized protein YfbU (UPF0304 family) n=2 Tax=Microbacterium phyllosphaerae TaxID=124798 RepID=A0ABS4WKZ6_9MICO|nr:uncharacterized protein YfbU (UPF0304 family) [Microbacterium phyllosphaerae]